MIHALAIDTPLGHDDLDGVMPPAATVRLVGHRGPFEAFTAAAASGRLHHAWLLHGPRGIGKATTAYAFARHLLAPGAERPGEGGDTVSFTPDNATVRKLALESHPGFIHVARPPVERGTGFRAQITVEEIRRLNRFFQSTAPDDGWRIALVDPADDMNRSAANALLKMLEEPPRRALFILVSHAPGRLLPTIRSRCRPARFEPLDAEAMARVLEGALPGAAVEDRALAIELAGGSVRRAITMLSHGGAEIDAALADALGKQRPDWNAIQKLADTVTAKGRETAYDLLVEALLAAIARAGEDALTADDVKGAARFAALWQDEAARLREAAAYNLDRKQVLLTAIDRIFEARAA